MCIYETSIEVYGRIFSMRILLLSTFLIWTPLIISNPVYIQIDGITSYVDPTRKLSENECYRNTSLKSIYDTKKIQTNGVIKLDLDKQVARVAVGVLDNNKEYTHATIWEIPTERDSYTEVRFETSEQLIKIRESSGSSFLPYARFEINRNTLEGDLWSEFDMGVCSSTAYDSSSLEWKSGEIIDEYLYRLLFNKIKIKDDEITQNFEETKKQTKKF